MAGPRTRICPSGLKPVASPISRTSASRASLGSASGQGWPSRQLPSISRAAMPASRTRGPSAHHTGPSPSQTRTGVQVKVSPAGTIAAARSASIIGPGKAHSLRRPRPCRGEGHSPDHRAGQGPRPLPVPQHSCERLRLEGPRKRIGVAGLGGLIRPHGGNDSRQSCGYCGTLRSSARRDARTPRAQRAKIAVGSKGIVPAFRPAK